eukprot:m.309691 g.309691  ORF g.309691 m.309691 type:complete len:283 (-) comp23585_c0_seq1:133-981(-)
MASRRRSAAAAAEESPEQPEYTDIDVIGTQGAAALAAALAKAAVRVGPESDTKSRAGQQVEALLHALQPAAQHAVQQLSIVHHALPALCKLSTLVPWQMQALRVLACLNFRRPTTAALFVMEGGLAQVHAVLLARDAPSAARRRALTVASTVFKTYCSSQSMSDMLLTPLRLSTAVRPSPRYRTNVLIGLAFLLGLAYDMESPVVAKQLQRDLSQEQFASLVVSLESSDEPDERQLLDCLVETLELSAAGEELNVILGRPNASSSVCDAANLLGKMSLGEAL